MFASMRDGVLAATADGRVVMANEAAARIFEVMVDELLIPVVDYPARFSLRELPGAPTTPVEQRALQGEIDPPVERLIRTAAGNKVIRTSAAPLRDEQGRIIGAVVLAADITAKTKEEARAREQAERLQRALADAEHAAALLEYGDAFLELDARWRILRVNQLQEKMSGKPRSETVGRVLWEVWPDAADPQTRYWSEYHRCMAERVPVQFEDYFAPLDLWMGITAYPSRGGGIAIYLRDISRQKRAEVALRDEHAFTTAVLDTVSNLVIVLDHDGHIVRVNRACELATGYTAAELTGRLIFDVLIPEDDLAGVRETFRRLSAGMFPSHYENRWRMKDGSVRLLEWANTCIVDAAGKVKFVIGTGIDITERRRQDERLRETEARFRTLTEVMPQIVCALTPDGQAEYVNPRWTAFSGLELAATREAGWRGILHPDDFPRAMECRRLVLKTLAPQEVELRYRAADGAFRWFLSRLAPVVEHGQVIRLIGAAMDIDDRKRAADALRKSEHDLRQYADLVEHAPVLVRNLASEIIVWNQGMERLYGWTRAEALGKVSNDLLCTRFPQPLPEIEATVVHEGRWEGELRHCHRSGAEMVVASTWVLHRGDDGEPSAIIEVDTDITELKRAQEALREADRRKDDFLGMLSHELRNPLAPIRNALYILDRAEPTGQQARRAKDVATRQVAHITRLVDDLLDVTRIARGKIDLRRANLDLVGLARHTADDYRSLLHDRGLTLAVEAPAGAVVVNGDETRLAQILGNLLSNAAKFTPAGGRVTISIRVEDGRAVVRVRDTGPGIEPDVLPSIFEPFTQAKQTLARTEGGLGLGLALVKGLVAMHGGEVAVTSSGGGPGTEFVVALPLASAREPDAGSRSPERTTGGTARRLRVLVIDDNRDAADSLAELVAMLGHEPVVAYDALQALARAAEQVPDVVVCDIGLPGMDGYEFARQFRELCSKYPVRLVALSGYAQPEDVANAMAAGFDEHVAKPPDPERLARILVTQPPSTATA
jgi:PAS domain S-box-containing protein